jgi:hypothetical protein
MEFWTADGKEKLYEEWKTKNTDAYGAATVGYAESWALMLQQIIETETSPEKAIEKHADRLSHEADTEGITGFMYGMAVQMLSSCWRHGEILRKWHNLKTQIKDEGEKANKSNGVLNPAILNINTE